MDDREGVGEGICLLFDRVRWRTARAPFPGIVDVTGAAGEQECRDPQSRYVIDDFLPVGSGGTATGLEVIAVEWDCLHLLMVLAALLWG